MKMRWLLLAALTAAMYGQNTRYDSNLTQAGTNVPPGASAPVYTVPNALVTVCGYPASGSPCTNTVVVYSDQAGTQPISQPLHADSSGRFGFWIPPGQYSYSVQSSSGKNIGTWPLTLTAQQGPPGTNSVTTTNGTSGSFLVPANMTAGNSTLVTAVTDPVLGSVPTRLISKNATSDSSANAAALLDASGRPIAQFDGAGRLNLDGYQSGGSLIDLRNWNTLSSGGLIGHYAFGMTTSTGQAITSGIVSNIMNTNAQTNVNTQIQLRFAKGLNASTCPSFCQPNGLVSVGPTSIALYDGLSIDFYDQTTLAEIQGQINHVLQLRPRASGDGFVFPNNSNTWLHVDTAKNIRFINDGTRASIQSVNDAGSAFQPLDVVANPFTAGGTAVCNRDNDGGCSLQRVFVTPCSAAASSSCTYTVNLGHTWPDTSYSPACNPSNVTAGIPIVASTANINGSSFAVTIRNLDTVAATSANLNCVVLRAP